MWVDGPYPAAQNDLNVFRGGRVEDEKDKWDRNALYFQLPEGKMVIADDGLKGEPTKILVQSLNQPKELFEWQGKLKARQETLHTRLKNWKILKHRFYHGKNTELRMEMHQMAVEGICVITQYSYENGHPPFDVNMPMSLK